MSNAIDALGKLTKDEQSLLLAMISNSSHELTHIEIDDVTYQIPVPVSNLIDNLALQIKELSVIGRDNALIN
tara:strand:- start:6786 stop:7001 length:216 start_codon:yes stop_codon:yes gene_type:complete